MGIVSDSDLAVLSAAQHLARTVPDAAVRAVILEMAAKPFAACVSVADGMVTLDTKRLDHTDWLALHRAVRSESQLVQDFPRSRTAGWTPWDGAPTPHDHPGRKLWLWSVAMGEPRMCVVGDDGTWLYEGSRTQVLRTVPHPTHCHEVEAPPPPRIA